MSNSSQSIADHPSLKADIESGLLTPAQAKLVESLVADRQGHLFKDWDAVGKESDRKKAFIDSLEKADTAYPGGLAAYIRNARRLLADASSGANPLDGCTPEQPDLVDLSNFGTEYDKAEAAGLGCFSDSAVVLVAGGLGERLGYHGIKLDIPVEVTESTSYLAHFCSVIKAASERLGKKIPLIIMTSRDTDAGTKKTLLANANFGLAEGQITILRQELVPALADIDASLALDGKYSLQLKPHGHGDIHTLLHTSGTAKKLEASGVRYLLFIQDTNGQVFNAAFAAIGVSELHGYDFNSVAVNRIPGEAVGGMVRLVRKNAADLTLNVEYNLLDPLLRATVSPEGDVANEKGFSRFPGNINVIVVRLAPYLRVLEESGGIVAEFVNPKFADASRTKFKKPARLETLMQDLPKNFTSGEKVGVTIFDRSWCFSACKNNLVEAAAKVAQNGPPESASSAENDFYKAGRFKLRAAGMEVVEGPVQNIRGIPVTTGPRVILRPPFALTLADVRDRISGGKISGDSTLILEGDVKLKNVEVPDGASLVLKGSPSGPVETSPSYIVRLLDDAEMNSADMPEYLRIRGYRIEAQ